MFKIGKLKLKSKLILAPMAGISDLPYRLLNRKFGCELTFIEMINCRSISHKSRRTREMLKSLPLERPLGIQILGKEENYILKAIDVLREYKFDLLDFNAACPAKKVVRRGEGAALLKEPKRLRQLLKVIVNNSDHPVSVKIRSGWDKDSINAREVSLYAQEAGIDALFIHGRTKFQGYSGSVDYNVIRQVKKALSIPVIASGDIFCVESIKKMFDETGCDAVIIARGALGNPWIFKDYISYIKTGKVNARPEISKIQKIMQGHLKSCVDFYGERIGIVKFRKFFTWYTIGRKKVRPLREKSSRAKTEQEMLQIINSLI